MKGNRDLYDETYTESVTINLADHGYATDITEFIQHSVGDEIVEVVVTFDDAPSTLVELSDSSGAATFLEVGSDLSDLAGVDVATVEPTAGDALMFLGGEWGPGNHGNMSGLGDPDHPSYKSRLGFPFDSDTGYEVSLSYDATTRQVTITPSGATFDVWIAGTRHTFTGAQVSTAHADVSDAYFVYYNESGVLTTAAASWNILKHASACAITYNATGKYAAFALMELHTADRNPELHYRLHFGDGTTISSNPGPPVLSGFTLATDTTAAVTFGATAVKLLDEDIQLDTLALADGGPYRVAWREGVGGEWAIQTSSFADTTGIPFLSNGTTICFNENSGGTWQKTALATASLGRYVNVYLCATTSIIPSERYFLVPGQQTYADLNVATAENAQTGIAWGDAPPPEFVILAQLTYHARSVFSATTHRAELVAVEILSGRKSGAAASPGVTDHGYLAGLTDDDHTLYVLADGTRAFTGAVRLPVLTTAQRDALTPSAGWVIFNSTTTKQETYDGSTWQAAW